MSEEKFILPEIVDVRQDTTADEILSKFSNDTLKPMLTITNSRGSSGAPSHPVASANQTNSIR